MKKIVLTISSILASVSLIGATVAAFAVTDNADPLSVYISQKELEEDDTTYCVLSWGSKTSMLTSLGNVLPNSINKLGVISLKSSLNYTGVLSFALSDVTQGKTSGSKTFMDYLKIHLYSGANTNVEEGSLPETGHLLSTTLKQYTASYNYASGSPAGTDYSVYLECDLSAREVLSQVSSDIINLEIDWSPQESDKETENKTVYFVSDAWEQAYLYSWTDNEGCNAVFPGVKMSKIGLNQYGQTIYKGILLPGYEKMIFSNGGFGDGNQTQDLPISAFDFSDGDKLFYFDSTKQYGVDCITFEDSFVTTVKANLGVNPGSIFQAFSWSVSQVSAKLNDIANAGFKAIQLSPIQPVGGGSSTNDHWYMLYQPLGFKVAGNNQNPIGNRTSLTALTAAAKAKGIDIYVDVVINHLSGGNGTKGLNPQVATYEPVIYSNGLVHNRGSCVNYDDTEQLTKFDIGMPDVCTEDSRVQASIIGMLKDYMDCGVKGFRFDAAKHVETPKDGYFSSDFWPNVIGAINEYGIHDPDYSDVPYCYGEVLGAGGYRDMSGYTDYIDVTANALSSHIREKMTDSNEGGVYSYGFDEVGQAKHAVLFPETHDTYCHNQTNWISNEMINMIYAYEASRAQASTFYVARPTSSDIYNKYENYDYRIVVNSPSTVFNNNVVKAANQLHQNFIAGTEYLSAWAGCVINARVQGGKYGVLIANLDFASSAKVCVNTSSGLLPDGNYKDLVTGNIITINKDYNNEFTVSLTNGVAVLESV